MMSSAVHSENRVASPNSQSVKMWVAAGLWIIVIVIESSNLFSSEHTGHWLYPIFHFLTGVTALHFEVWHTYIRKTGHFVGYFVLSCLLFRAWKATLPQTAAWALRWAGIALFMTAFVASMDEWHQTYLPSRTGSLHDVFLDSFAALVAQLVIMAWLRGRAARGFAAAA